MTELMEDGPLPQVQESHEVLHIGVQHLEERLSKRKSQLKVTRNQDNSEVHLWDVGMKVKHLAVLSPIVSTLFISYFTNTGGHITCH